jgi:hypothetical protein
MVHAAGQTVDETPKHSRSQTARKWSVV